MKSLRTLIRVHKAKVNGKRRELAELERLAQDLIEQARQLEEEAKREWTVTRGSLEPAISYGGYVQAVIDRRRRLAASVAEVEKQIAAAHEEVRQAFAELKRFELTLAERQRREAEDAERREQAGQDEVGLTMFRRRPVKKRNTG